MSLKNKTLVQHGLDLVAIADDLKVRLDSLAREVVELREARRLAEILLRSVSHEEVCEEDSTWYEKREAWLKAYGVEQ